MNQPTPMLDRLLPSQIDNHYRGFGLALWLFIPIAALNLLIDLVAIFKADGGAQSADGIPLDSFPPDAARAVIGVAALLGLEGLLLGVFFILALVRYRAMIPLMYALLVLEYLGHKGIGAMKPIVREAGSHGVAVALTLFALTVAGLVLSLLGKGYRLGRVGEAG